MPTALERTLVVMPAYNEEEAVGDVVREVFQKVPGASVLVVDDGSRDATARVAQAAGATVLRLPINLGVGGAMRAGFKYALSKGFSNVVQVDSDGQHDPAGIAELVDRLADHDLVLGARFAGVGDYTVRGPRKWAMQVLSGILSRLTRTRLTDTTSGFRASGPRAVALFARHYPSEYLGDTVESLVIASRSGLSVTQVPVAMRARAGGVPSHNPYKAAVYLGRAGMALFVALIRPRLPLERTVAPLDEALTA
ncbi:glycosyltransferase family 2 protein [Herbiconiux sp. KACC 21604]|uniref:glycosyltransferase family 2 protein n=1 Tax=unclassified Herbiconiux TaxID=2618217 RepID=UPI0014929F30|nr:glycosyltransferase family 2 protein [Herbiconiux sp. SALV-R1]QJU54418.1 glycosyltransferase family 2 protein [Herbiconiux sp. SALV-R1]WPO85492.1 glycosyltransferase family 2 protein [Herbiconiux sp. KACC 21604]